MNLEVKTSTPLAILYVNLGLIQVSLEIISIFHNWI